MTSRTTTIMTGAVLVGIALIFFLKLTTSLFPNAIPSTYFEPGKVRGATLYYRNLPYTLNFDQQNHLIELINRSILIASPSPADTSPQDPSKVIIHPFTGNDIEILLLGAQGSNILFTLPSLPSGNILQDVSSGEFLDLLTTAHDPS